MNLAFVPPVMTKFVPATIGPQHNQMPRAWNGVAAALTLETPMTTKTNANERGPPKEANIRTGTVARADNKRLKHHNLPCRNGGLTDICRYRNILAVARSSTTSDVFNAIAEAHRREILDALITGEKAVGAIVDDLSMSQPQVSKHLRVLSEVGLVRCRAEGVAGCTAWNPHTFGRCTSGWPSTSRRGTTGWIGWMTTSKSYNKESGSDT